MRKNGFTFKMLNKRLLFLILILSIFSIGLVSAITFSSTILDSNQAYLNPSILIDQTSGIKHLFWSDGQDLIYTTSKNISDIQIIYSGSQQVGNIQTAIDSKDIIHLVFSVYNSEYRYYYWNSRDKNIIDLNVNYYENTPSIAVNPLDNSIYIALVDGKTAIDGIPTEENIVIVSSSNYVNFSYQYLDKESYQLEPKIGVDSKGIVHLAWWDWRDGVSGGAGQYKVIYSNLESNFENETYINLGSQSYSPSLIIYKDDVFIAFKDSINYKGDDPFSNGDIYVTNKSSNWTKERVTNSTIQFMQDRPIAFAIDKSGNKHVAWTEWYEDIVMIRYASSIDSFLKQEVQDISYEINLGYVSLATFDNKPFMIANIHSIASYEESVTLPTLQEQIDYLKLNLTILNNKIIELENRTTWIEKVINALFGWSSDFFAYFNSEDKCKNGALQCSGNNTQVCVNYEWVAKDTCSNGCTLGVCNKENCLLKPPVYSCSSLHSLKRGYVCPGNQGINTACNPGKCELNSKTKTYCRNYCNATTGRCN